MSDVPDLLPLLNVVSGPLQGVSFRLSPGTIVIGREDGVDIFLENLKVSRRHATVELVGGKVVLTDLRSTNGTWVNDERTAGPLQLRDGDRIRIGQVRLRFFDPASAPTDPIGAPAFVLLRQATTRSDGVPARTSAALSGPTSAIRTFRTRSTRTVVLVLGGCVALAGWAAWTYQWLQ
jgi:pSer/pThr/pTyr-binding forkhead associated (FHA) protein